MGNTEVCWKVGGHLFCKMVRSVPSSLGLSSLTLSQPQPWR